MKPELRFNVACTCGAENLVAASQAGAKIACAACGCRLAVPGLRELNALQSMDVSPLGRLQHAIESQEDAFDGSCQCCRTYSGTMVVPVRVVVADKKHEVTRAIAIPCIVCDMCAKEFRSGLWVGRLQSLGKALVSAVWLLIALVVASVIAIIMPLIGIYFVLAVMSCMLYHLTRKRANPFLLRHLNQVCRLTDTLRDVDEYVVTSQRIRPLSQAGHPR